MDIKHPKLSFIPFFRPVPVPARSAPTIDINGVIHVYLYIYIYIHPWKLTFPQKRDYVNRKYIFQPLIFRGHSFVFQGIYIHIYIYMSIYNPSKWMFPKMVDFPPNHPILIGVFHYTNHPFWGTPIFGSIQVAWKKHSFPPNNSVEPGPFRLALLRCRKRPVPATIGMIPVEQVEFFKTPQKPTK